MSKWEEYQKTIWVNDQTPVNQSNMNKIEDGIEDNRNNTLDLKTIAEAFITAFKDKLSLSFNSETHILTFKAGDDETEEIINAQASAQIYTSEAEVEELYNFLHQVARVYPIYWNILRYCSNPNKLYNVKLVSDGSIIPVDGYVVYNNIPLSVYKEASFSVDTLYIHTAGQLATPVYSIGFYNASNEIESVVIVGEDTTVNIPSWATAIAVCFLGTEEQDVIVAPTDLSFDDYNIYKLNVPTTLAELNDDSTHRTVTDAEKTTWNNKQSTITDLDDIRAGASAGATAVQPSTLTPITQDISSIKTKLNKTVAKNVTDTFTYSGDTVTYNKKNIDLNTGEETTSTETIALANDETAGVMSPSDYQQIRSNTARIEALEGRPVRLSYTAKANPTASEIQQFVYDSGYEDEEQWVYIAVVVRDTKHVWKYYTDTWQDDGVDTVTQFTNDSPGIIKGSSNDGQVYAETNGTGSVVGWDALKTRVTTVEQTLPNKQNTLTAGAGISISGNTISSTIQDKVFFVTYGDTRVAVWDEINNAISANKIIFTIYNSSVYVYSVQLSSASARYFTQLRQVNANGNSTSNPSISAIKLLYLSSSIEWSISNKDLEIMSNKVTSISSSSTDTQYPSAKAVYDALQALDLSGYVKYNESQTLTEQEKTQARTNIGASKFEVVEWN